MDLTLFRYWIFPLRWRRWPRLVRWGLTLALIGLSLYLGSIPLLVWLPDHAWAGFDGYFVLFEGMVFLALVDIGAALAGATILAAERERGTWEPLTLTPLGIAAIVRTKLMARALLCAGVVALTLPFWLAQAYEVLAVNDGEERAYFSGDGHLSSAWVAARIGLYLAWLALRIVGRVLPFLTWGLALSARCARTRTALMLTAGSLFGLCIALWFAVGPSLAFLFPKLPSRDLMLIAGWPLFPNDFMYYARTGLVSTKWRADLIADGIWLVILPYLLYRLAVRWSVRARIAAPKSRLSGVE